MYSEWLVRRGENIHAGRDTAILERLLVRDFLDDNPDVIGESATVKQIMRAIGQSKQIEFPVLDADLKLAGMLTYADLRTVLTDTERYSDLVLAGDLAVKQFESVSPRDSLRAALQKLAVRGSHVIPVVGDADPEKLLGVIGRQEILAAYDRELLTQG
jgi:CIC family chloride channel protein